MKYDKLRLNCEAYLAADEARRGKRITPYALREATIDLLAETWNVMAEKALERGDLAALRDLEGLFA